MIIIKYLPKGDGNIYLKPQSLMGTNSPLLIHFGCLKDEVRSLSLPFVCNKLRTVCAKRNVLNTETIDNDSVSASHCA